MALTDVAVRTAKCRDKEYKLADSKGLYLLVTPSGGKLWRYKFRLHGMEKKLSLGRYPDVSISEARKQRDNAREAVGACMNCLSLQVISETTFDPATMYSVF